MDPARNPFTPGAGARPPTLAGRRAEIDAGVVAATRMGNGLHARSLLLTGFRGVGKTVLLGEFGRRVEDLGWACGRVEAAPDRSFPEEVADLAGNALLDLARGEAPGPRTRRAAAVLRSFRARWNLPGSVDFEIGAEPAEGLADSGLLHHDLGGLLGQVGAAARERGAGVFWEIDELQDLGRAELSALVAALHRIGQDGLPLLVAAAGLPSLFGLLGEAASYSERLFEFRVLHGLRPEEAREALETPVEAAGVRFRRGAVDRIVEWTSGFPYFVQEFGRAVWDTAAGPEVITLEEAEAAAPKALARLDDGFFRVRFDRASAEDRALLFAMASLGAGPYPERDLRAASGLRASDFDSRLDSLARTGLCVSPRHGEVDFTVPLFDRFLRRETARAAGRK